MFHFIYIVPEVNREHGGFGGNCQRLGCARTSGILSVVDIIPRSSGALLVAAALFWACSPTSIGQPDGLLEEADSGSNDGGDAPSGEEGAPPGDDGAGCDGDAAGGDEEAADGDSSGTDKTPEPLSLTAIEPAFGGASVATPVAIHGTGFAPGLQIFVGGTPAGNVTVQSPILASAVFLPVALTERGAKDVRAVLGAQEAVRPRAFEYLFDEDPIVFVHGYAMNASEWDTMKGRFRELGYPEEALCAIQFSDITGSNVVNARDELPPFVAGVLERWGADKVDLVAHSNGGLSSRLWIRQYGGAGQVRDYVSLSGTHHGTQTSCLGGWLGEAARETCPAYASQAESHNDVQWTLNGDPDTADVDETPSGVEDGGGIYWNALWTDGDLIDVPAHTCCLNQQFRGDCSDPVNVRFSGVGHIEMATEPAVFEKTRDLIRAHNRSRP